MGHENDGKDTLPMNHAADFYVPKKNDCTESSTVSDLQWLSNHPKSRMNEAEKKRYAKKALSLPQVCPHHTHLYSSKH